MVEALDLGWFDYHLAMSWLDLTYQMTGKRF